MRKDLYIFIGNKLISTDTVLPLAYELKNRKLVNRVYFVTIDLFTYNSIKKNYFTFNAINNIGKILFLGNIHKIYKNQSVTTYKKIKSFLFRQVAKINLIPFLIVLIIKCLFNKGVIFHFRLLDLFPFKYISKFIKSSIYKMDRIWDCNLISEVTYLNPKFSPSFINIPETTGNIIYFHKDSNLLKDTRNFKKKKIFLPPTSNYSNWVNFLKENYKIYINNELKRHQLKPNQNIITIMLGSFSPLLFLKNKNTTRLCLQEVLETLLSLKSNLPIFIKPHVVSEENIFMSIVESMRNKNIIISHLHPGILAMASKVVIANYFSYTLSTANLLCVPTVEYTDYHKKALKMTNQSSMYPKYVDFFINRDKKKLKDVLLNCLRKKKKVLIPCSPEKRVLNSIIKPL